MFKIIVKNTIFSEHPACRDAYKIFRVLNFDNLALYNIINFVIPYPLYLE